MLSVCFCYTNKAWNLNQWGYVLASYEVEKIYILGPKGVRITGSSLVTHAIQMDTADELPLGPSLVVAAPTNGRFIKGDENLEDFVHPEDVIYVFGSDNIHLSEDYLGKREADHKVYISNYTHFEIFAHVAAGIFLYDRRRKANG